jgi:protein arginine N-methyltransferase 1
VYGVDMRVIKPSVEAEPVVDYVNREDVISDSCTFADFDLYKVTKGDLTFANKYECVISKNASLDAFVIWFDVMFGKLRKPVELSTSPFAKKTHWSQTILYLKDSIRCNKGDKVYGTIAMRKNPKRFRDLDIVLTINYKSDGSLMKKKYLYKLT